VLGFELTLHGLIVFDRGGDRCAGASKALGICRFSFQGNCLLKLSQTKMVSMDGRQHKLRTLQ